MSPNVEVSQRDLRLRSKEIMDAVEAGETFTITRDGREIAELVPLRRRRRFVPAAEFLAAAEGLPSVDLGRLRAETDGALDPDVHDPFER